MNGAQGGMVTADNRDLDQPRDPQRGYWNDSRSWDECLRIGHLMAARRSASSRTPRSRKNPTLFCDSIDVRFPVDSKLMWAVVVGSPLKYPHNDDHSINARINLVNLGDAQILTIPGEALAEHRLLSQAQDARQEQPALRPHQRGLRLHLDEGRFPEFPALRLCLAHVARRNDRRDPDREVARVRQQVAAAGSMRLSLSVLADEFAALQTCLRMN